MLSFVACSPSVSEDDSAEKVITEYVTTFYTITNDDLELYKKIVRGSTDVNALISDSNKANEKFKSLMTDKAYEAIIADRIAYMRCKEASEGKYTVSVSKVKLEKDSQDQQTKTYYYDIELTQTPISGDKVKNIKNKKQITVAKVNDTWKVSNSYTYGY